MAERPQHQLALAITLRDDATFSNFLAQPAVQPAIDSLRLQARPDGEPLLYLWGGEGSGKTHLLQACCQESGGATLYLPLAQLCDDDPAEILHGLEGLQHVCIDDVQSVAGAEAWELALFNFINLARESGCRLVFAATAPPRTLPVKLPDLQSRLGWGAVFQLPRVEDDDKAAILRFRAARRGLELSEGVASYIISRAPREMGSLLVLLDDLDRASLTQKRAISVPFVKETLRW